MIYYSFDAKTGEYGGQRAAQIDPLETQMAGSVVFTKPGILETDQPPPAVGPGQAAVWANGWSVVEDRRGETWYSAEGEPIKIKDLGSPAASGLLAQQPVLPPTKSDVDAERDRRMGTFTFFGKEYDLTGQSLANVQAAATLALSALINGAQPGDLRWADPDTDFTWIANDNTQTPMDAATCMAFAQAAAAHRKNIIFKARALKDVTPIPPAFTSDSYWIS